MTDTTKYTRDYFHMEFAGIIYNYDFDTQGGIHQRSSRKRQYTIVERNVHNYVFKAKKTL